MQSVADHETLMPATVFNLCDLPHDGYGLSGESAPRIASNFLKIFAVAALTGKPTISRAEFKSNLEFFHANASRKTKQWQTLYKFVDALESELKSNNEEVNLLAFGRDHLGPLAGMVGQSLATANRKIKMNVLKQLIDRYGHRAN
jgi:hypothetical protein